MDQVLCLDKEINICIFCFRSANYTKPGQYVKCFHNPEKVSYFIICNQALIRQKSFIEQIYNNFIRKIYKATKDKILHSNYLISLFRLFCLVKIIILILGIDTSQSLPLGMSGRCVYLLSC